MKLSVGSLSIVSAVFLAGCSHLPLDGPAHRDISWGAAATLTVDRHAIGYDYALVDISPGVLDLLDHVGTGSFHRHLGLRSGPRSGAVVGIGDVISISVFESAAGGLFLPAESGPRPANYVTIPNQFVSRSGSITVPYAGSVKVAGRTPQEIGREIERKLADRAIEPQVVVSLIEQNGASVSVIGDMGNGANRFKIAGEGERVLDMISRAGGLRFPGYEMFVTMQRGSHRATVHFPRLIMDPSENVYVSPGDTIYVYREQQKFVAIGALGTSQQTSGLTGQFAFEQERLSLNEGLAKAGGLQDSRANPAQVFVYRIEQRELLEKFNVDLSKFPAEQKLIPSVYRINYRDPSSFFLAQKFAMRNKDIIYAANSDATEIVKFLSYLRAVTSTVAGVGVDGATTRDIVLGRHIIPAN